ncbi:MAG TPA: ACP S-malonyltransferase [Terriglobia bacterium]|nr:ACP S-malonyltransferase [Terriglobia bacterium]
MHKIALLFPGQGSQASGMGRELFDALPNARAVFEEADRALGFPLAKLCFEGPAEELQLTANAQPAILAASVAAAEALRAGGVRADFVAGHSLGEYSALVVARALRLADALRLVRKRGEYMQQAVPVGEGAMAALLGGAPESVEALCREAAQGEVCSPANHNSPGQVVIAGHTAAVERAVKSAPQHGIRRAVMLKVSAPFHCSLMQPAAEKLAHDLDALEIQDAEIPLVNNVDARFVTRAEEIREGLKRQVTSPVRWEESMTKLLAEPVNLFIEAGPGRVLCGLMRQIDRNAECLNVEDMASFEGSVERLKGLAIQN